SACARMSFALWLVLTSVAGCSWQPIARDVEPVLLIPGPARDVRMLDSEGHYALVKIGESAPYTLHIVRLETREHCQLPAGADVRDDIGGLTAPNLRGEAARAFVLPFFQQDGGQEADQSNVYFADEKCAVLGPFAESLRQEFADRPGFFYDMQISQLRSDSRNVALVRDREATLRLIDPWTGTVTKLAEDVARIDDVARSDASSAPQALWLLEAGKLTQRALDGTLLLSLGTNVAAFTQTLRDQLRVAYVDNDNLYEAKGPDFTPVLVAEGACAPGYQDSALDLWLPCSDRQLVRINLQDGTIRRFEPKVYASYTTAELTFDLAHDNPDDPDDYSVYVSDGVTGTAPRAKLDPRSAGDRVSVISGKRMVSLSVNAQLGIWTLDGKYTAGYRGVERSQAFRDQRTGQLLWLIAYAVENNVATLGVVEQRQLEGVVASIQADAGVPGTSDAAVPAARPLVIAERAHKFGYGVFYPPTAGEPVIVSLEPTITVIDRWTFTGSLHAHLLSAELSSSIDEGVQSFQGVSGPVPGILYSILQGPRAGLWFAAL
ncbi:MAG TPA: hypothetical protein VFX59_09220, partial [Polyangiales bacterium]|nr:hypothetical protein [Polyangiales bacterium]